MAVPTTAQRDQRDGRRAPTRAQRDVPVSSVHREHPARAQSGRTGRSGPVVGGGHTRGSGRVIAGAGNRDYSRGHGNGGRRGNRGPTVVLGGGRRGSEVRYRYVTRKVWVPPRERRVLIPARYEMRWDPYCRQYVRVCVREAYYETRCDPGYWDYRQVKVPYYVDRGGRRSGGRGHLRFRF